MRRRSRGIVIGALVLTSMLAMASIAVGIPVVDGNYAGSTTQRNPADHQHWVVTFSISRHFIRNLDFDINDKCPDGTRLIVHSFGYRPMKIHPKGKFGGRFGVRNGVPGEGSLIRGQVSGQTVTADVDDFGLNKNENILCHGVASLTAAPAASPTSPTAAPAATATSRAADPRYSGKTAQGRSISFTVSRGFVRKLTYHIYDRCPSGRAIMDYDSSFPPIRIKANGSFGGRFLDPGRRATAIVSGKVSGRRVTGCADGHRRAPRLSHHLPRPHDVRKAGVRTTTLPVLRRLGARSITMPSANEWPGEATKHQLIIHIRRCSPRAGITALLVKKDLVHLGFRNQS